MQDKNSLNIDQCVPSFIITRYTHGAAGKFFSSVLQTSRQIDHWSIILQNLKYRQPLFDQVSLQYISRSFPKDHSLYLRSEPMVPYNSDLYSTGYIRGNNVTIDQYISNAIQQNDLRLLDCLQKNLAVNLIFNKPCIPLFCNNSKVVTITVCSKKEKQWLYKTLWSKHFLEKDDKICYLPSHPDFCNFSSLVPVLTYGNEYEFPAIKKQQLYEEYVLNNHTNSWYFEPEKFSEHDTEKNLNNFFISLEEILCPGFFLDAVSKTFRYFDMEPPCMNLVKQMYEIWMSRQFLYE